MPLTTRHLPKPVKSYANGTKGVTEAGYDYVHHVSNNTIKPRVGDQIKYHRIMYQNDTTLIESTYFLLEPRADILIPPEAVPQPAHPTYHAMYLMSPGDSMTIYQPMAGIPKESIPKRLTSEDKLTYVLKVLSIKRKEVIEKEIAATKARALTVKDSLQNFIKEYKSGKLDNQLVTTESGLKYFINKEGKGKKVKDGGFVKVHYVGDA